MKAFDMGTMPRTSMKSIRAACGQSARGRASPDSFSTTVQLRHNAYLLAGSYAYDTVLQHPKAFRERILPEAIDRLNVSFNIESVVDAFGGCAGNIAYNAALLGDAPMLVGNLGHDGARYRARIEGWGLDTSHLGHVENHPTAHAWMLTDERANQIISFHSGAMRAPVEIRPFSTPTLWHIAPEDPVNMVKLSLAARDAGTDYLFDAGQALPALLEGAAERLVPFGAVLFDAKGFFLNEYEFELLSKRLSVPSLLLTPGNRFAVLTRGSAGVDLYQRGRTLSLPPAKADAVVDPTGCGDAFRAGFLHAYVREQSLEACVALGAVMGALAVGSEGGQNHTATKREIYERWERYCDDNHIQTKPDTFRMLRPE